MIFYDFGRVKVNEVSLNIDGLTTTKVDAKVASIIFAEVHIIEKIEIMPDKVDPKLIEKVYELNARRPKKSEEKGSKKVS